MVTHTIFVPSYGKDPKKFVSIPRFEGKTKATLFKRVVDSFHMAGKIKDFVNEHTIAMYCVHSNYNGYGYTDHDYKYLMNNKDAQTVLEMLHVKSEKRPKKSQDEKIMTWAKRLHKLTGVPVDVCLSIAEEKLKYKKDRINELEGRQNEYYSSKRQKLIDKLGRENPLRRIKDSEHASRILAASVRHNSSNYDYMLEEARDKALWGEIDFSEIKQYAKEHTTYWEDVNSKFFGENDDDESDGDEGEEGDNEEV